MLEYIKYCYDWYKDHGFKKYWCVGQSDVIEEWFLGPKAYFVNKRERQKWIQAAKDCKSRYALKESHRFPYNSRKP